MDFAILSKSLVLLMSFLNFFGCDGQLCACVLKYLSDRSRQHLSMRVQYNRGIQTVPSPRRQVATPHHILPAPASSQSTRAVCGPGSVFSKLHGTQEFNPKLNVVIAVRGRDVVGFQKENSI